MHSVGRNGQVEEPANEAADGLLGFRHHGAQTLDAVVGVDGEAETLGESSHSLPSGLSEANSEMASKAYVRNWSSVILATADGRIP